MDNCGISRTVRTIYYDAGVALFNIFINTESTLAKQLRSYHIECLTECMEMFNELYTNAEYGNYDITIVEPSMYLELCMEECSYNIPVAMKKALCYGIYRLLF